MKRLLNKWKSLVPAKVNTNSNYHSGERGMQPPAPASTCAWRASPPTSASFRPRWPPAIVSGSTADTKFFSKWVRTSKSAACRRRGWGRRQTWKAARPGRRRPPCPRSWTGAEVAWTKTVTEKREIAVLFRIEINTQRHLWASYALVLSLKTLGRGCRTVVSKRSHLLFGRCAFS